MTLALMLFDLHSQDTFTRVYGGVQDEHAMTVTATRDGGYVVAGFTFSYGKGKSDIWVMKVDEMGEEMWREYMGGEDFDWANDLIETRDGNYVVAGYTREAETSKSNAWVFQLNRHGELMWSHIFGGEKSDEAKAVIQTSDGGFAVAGFSFSYAKGQSDIWMLRLNAVGDEIWQETYGGTGTEQAYSIIETKDEGFLLGGFQTYGKTNKADMLLVKVDRKGKGLWRKPIQAVGNDVVESVVETPEGDYLAAGWAYSNANKSLDAKVVKVSPGGKILWEQSYGGKGKDAVYDIIRTPDNAYVMAGQTGSFNNSSDFWILKLKGDGKTIWQKRTNGDKNDWAHAVALAKDGGYVVVGGTKSYATKGSDMCLLKTDSRGNFGPGPVKAEGIEVDDMPPMVVSRPGIDPFKPNLYILSIGVSDFEDKSVDLTFAHTDAQAIAKKFRTQKGQLFNEVQVKELVNEDATLVNIKTAISWLERQATQKDMILIFLSSHGALDNKGNLYILPTDFDARNLFATALNIRDLTEGMNGTPCKKLIFLDACHSGQSGYDLLEFASIKSANLNNVVEEFINKEPGVTVMTSSSGKEFSYENPRWGHGAFTKAILEGLNGEADFNKDEVINLMELNLYVTERVKRLTDGRQHPFTPINLFGDIPLFILN